MPSGFEIASAVQSLGDGKFRAEFPDGWQQGRGAFGGLVLATLQRAMAATLKRPERRLRALTGELCGPVLPGEATLEVEVLRQGANVSYLDARLLQGAKVQARAGAVYAAGRSSSGIQPPPPAIPSEWEQVEVVPVQPPFGPHFAMHYEYRSTGPLPLSGGEAVAAGFIREKDPLSVLDASAVLGRLDAWWPALFPVEKELRPMATVSFTGELLVVPEGLDPRLPFFHRAHVQALAEGFFVEFRELWSGATLVAMNQQTFAILG